MGERVFVCNIEPRGDGGWDLWLSEQPYRGVDTDAVCAKFGDRKRVGAAYTSRWHVGQRRLASVARYVAARVVRDAEVLAIKNDAENEVWRQNGVRKAVRVTSEQEARDA